MMSSADFDEVEFIENLNMELKIFAKDLIEQAKSNGHAAKHWIKNDKFLSHLCDEGECLISNVTYQF